MRPERPTLSFISVVTVLTALFVSVAWSQTAGDQVIRITAKRFEYSPREITVKKGIPVVLEFTSLDRLHGFNCPGLSIRADIPPKKTTVLRFVPEKAGTFPFHCDVFCGSGHEGMTGTIIVEE